MKSLKYLKANSAFLTGSVCLPSPAVLGPGTGWCTGAQGRLPSSTTRGDPVPGQALLASAVSWLRDLGQAISDSRPQFPHPHRGWCATWETG